MRPGYPDAPEPDRAIAAATAHASTPPIQENRQMSVTAEVQSGLEGVVAFATEIAEPDRDGGALRYRGVDIEELVGNVPFEQVWGLLVDGKLLPGCRPPRPSRWASARATLASTCSRRWRCSRRSGGFGQLIDIYDEEARDNLARASVMALSFVAQSARGIGKPPVSQREVDKADVDPRAVPDPLARRGRSAPRQGDRRVLDLGRRARDERLDVHRAGGRLDRRRRRRGAVGRGRRAVRPAPRRRPSRVLKMLDDVAEMGDADRYVKDLLDRGERLMGFGHRVYRAEDPARAGAAPHRASRSTRRAWRSPRRSRQAALAELQARRPDRVLATNVEFWSAVVLDFADVPPELFTPLFTCARTAGWSAHILEQKREGRLVRPTAKYVGPGPRPLSDLKTT